MVSRKVRARSRKTRKNRKRRRRGRGLGSNFGGPEPAVPAPIPLLSQPDTGAPLRDQIAPQAAIPLGLIPMPDMPPPPHPTWSARTYKCGRCESTKLREAFGRSGEQFSNGIRVCKTCRWFKKTQGQLRSRQEKLVRWQRAQKQKRRHKTTRKRK